MVSKQAGGVGLAAALSAMLFAPHPASAQLRPLEPLDWSVFEPGTAWTASLGAAVFPEAEISLAGSRGRLMELGNAAFAMRFDRIALEANGTMRRRLDREEQVNTPFDGTRSPDGEPRSDAGDIHVATAVRLTPERSRLTAALRFGTRLPTTDNTKGMGRDQTDFFALVGGRFAFPRGRLAAEAGVGLNSTRVPDFEQADVLLYAVSGQVELGPARALAEVLGQRNGFDGWRIRGIDDLSELRIGAEIGSSRWVRVQLVRGLTDFGVRSGAMVTAGLRSPR